MVLFGVSGDLAHRKVLPALYDLANRGLLPINFELLGVARRPWSNADLRREAHAAVASGARTPFRQRVWEDFAARLTYLQGDVRSWATFERLKAALSKIEATHGMLDRRLFYLAVPPDCYTDALQGLLNAGLASSGRSHDRLVIERPYGFDSASSQFLDDLTHQGFGEQAVYRMDPYLGSQIMRTLVALRFTNRLLDAVWNCEHVTHVEITMGEDQGVDNRTGYYDQVGALRDVMTGHVLQLLAATAMECPESMDAAAIRRSREQVLRQITLAGPVDQAAVRGQFAAGWQGNIPVKGYRDHPAVPPDSHTETYVALKLLVNSARWQGVPFFVRTGKRLARRVTEVTLTLKPASSSPMNRPDAADPGLVAGNAIVLRTRPDSAVNLVLNTKVPNTQFSLRPMSLDFSHGFAFAESLPEGFEQELFDVLAGREPYFQSSTEVAESWRIVEPVLQSWQTSNQPPFPYPAGSWGPGAADGLPASEGFTWRRP